MRPSICTACRKLPATVGDQLPVSLGNEFRSDLVSQPPNLAFANHAPRHLDSRSGIAKRGKSSGRSDDAFDGGGAGAVLVEPQSHAQSGEKSRRQSGTGRCAYPVGRGSLCGERSGVRFRGTDLTAVRIGLLPGELAGLLLEEQSERSFGQSVRGGGGDLLEGSEVHVQTRPVVAEGALGNNLRPACRQIVELLEFLGTNRSAGANPPSPAPRFARGGGSRAVRRSRSGHGPDLALVLDFQELTQELLVDTKLVRSGNV
ncbi:unnamed protein product [Gemmata massiliana]|uniref:Uncharacterized protein n=1 Tax=Gemmata massiliana TaxID=1210884 RepID=A0A6P2D474_9BACT|nr:unnamed protein product [Gemmata massiliana]